ncbi:MAG: MBOAT family protein [Lachnospiraceae bacterium]|nr:MBOAT family protein [Lachnospiraceae bacterium]
MITITNLILFAILLILYYNVPQKWQKHLLLTANILFAVLMGIDTVVALLAVSIIVFAGVRSMSKKENKKPWMAGLVTVIVLILVTVKYLGFICGLAGIDLSTWVVRPVQVIGISFYSLRLISYIVDVYHGQEAEEDFDDFFCFVSFFPILTAGPIERSEYLMTQLSGYKTFDEQKVYRGFITALYGLFLKQVIADRLGVLVDEVYSDIGSYSGALCLIIIVFYSFQIYADFAGYSYIAIGMSRMLGIDIMQNFERPYLAVSIRDFWHRWHISLSRWLRDYIYIPLGGNKKGRLRKSINILITFLISGLWHGAGLNFIVWGGLHGIYQVAEDITDSGKEKNKSDSLTGRILHIVLTFILVTVAWVFFRADSVSQAFMMFAKIIDGPGFKSLGDGAIFDLGLGRLQVIGIILSLIVMVVIDILQEIKVITIDRFVGSRRVIRWVLSYAAILWIITAAIQLYGISEEAAFIYAAF